MITGHGDDSFRLETPIRIDFSSNVWYNAISPGLIKHLRQNLKIISHYPEPDAASFCRMAALFHSVDKSQVLAFNGSVEAFYTIALAFRGSSSTILSPAFTEYEDACRMHNHQIKYFTADQGLKDVGDKVGMYWLGNPNNPDGFIFSFTEIGEFLRKHPQTILVADEAYAAFIPQFQSAVQLTKIYNNLIIVCSLTKCCSIPGLRVGYVVASEKLAVKLREFQQPWSMNTLAQLAGKFLFEYNVPNKLDKIAIIQLSKNLQEEIDRLEGFRVIRSEAPFFLVEMYCGSSAQLKEFLIRQHGILIRDASNFHGLNERFFRICTRNKADNHLLINGLKCFLNQFENGK
jgi:threonine-phosphate decarboxylase